MGRRQRGKGKQGKDALQKHQEEEAKPAQWEENVEPAVALLALHLSGNVIAVAKGTSLRVWHTREAPAVLGKPSHESSHSAPIRALAFSGDGSLLLSGGDDKCLCIWEAPTWQLRQTLRAPKKVSAAAFTRDAAHALFADKFGDVLVAPTRPSTSTSIPGTSSNSPGPGSGLSAVAAAPAAPLNGGGAAAAASTNGSAEGGPKHQQPALLLGHFCAIITCLAVSPDGRHVASTDKDGKVRVSIVPPDPMLGAHEVESFCMGHTSFVTCAAFMTHGGATRLVSGGGDGTVRLWNHLTAEQLACLQLTQPQHQCGDAEEAGAADAEPSHQGNGEDERGEDGQAMATGGGAEAANADGRHQEDQAGEAEAAGSGEEAASDGGSDSEDGGDGDGPGDEAGDGTRRRWRPRGRREAGCPAVLALAASPDGLTVAVAVEGSDAIQLLACDPAAGTLARGETLSPAPPFRLPSRLEFDSEGRLWAAGGLPGGSAGDSLLLAVFEKSAEGWREAGDAVLPAAAREFLEARPEGEEPLAADLAAVLQVNQQLKKRVYSAEEVLQRKRNRNDVKAAGE